MSSFKFKQQKKVKKEQISYFNKKNTNEYKHKTCLKNKKKTLSMIQQRNNTKKSFRKVVILIVSI